MNTNYYELHVTVRPLGATTFKSFCTDNNYKFLFIALDKGEFKYQLMLAATAELPDDAAALLWAGEIDKKVAEKFDVVRVKLESRLVAGPNEYYEAHWKLNFGADIEYWDGETRQFLKEHPLLYSHSFNDGCIHYLSQRIYNSEEYMEASRTFNASGVAINFAGLPLVKTHYERCVWDSNPEIDNGWIA